jgi:hypothetical protein
MEGFTVSLAGKGTGFCGFGRFGSVFAVYVCFPCNRTSFAMESIDAPKRTNMKKTSIAGLAGLFFVAFIAGFLIMNTLQKYGTYLSTATVSLIVLLALLSLYVLYRGLKVKAFIEGKNPKLKPIYASHTLILAKTLSVTGAIFLGWFGAEIVSIIGMLQYAFAENTALLAGVTCAASVLLMISALLSEHFCTIPPPQGTQGEEGK